MTIRFACCFRAARRPTRGLFDCSAARLRNTTFGDRNMTAFVPRICRAFTCKGCLVMWLAFSAAAATGSSLAQPSITEPNRENAVADIRRITEPAGVQLRGVGSGDVPCQLRRGDRVVVTGAASEGVIDAQSPMVDFRVLSGSCAGSMGKSTPMALRALLAAKPVRSGGQLAASPSTAR